MSLASNVLGFVQAVGADVKTLLTGLATKVDKVTGKGLSTNDYTTTEQTKVAAVNLPGYDNQVTIAASTGAQTLNLEAAQVFDLTLTGNTVLTLSNIPTPPAGKTFFFIIRLTSGATKYTITWPTGLTYTWLGTGGVVGDTPAVGKVIEYVFSTVNGTTAIARKGPSN